MNETTMRINRSVLTDKTGATFTIHDVKREFKKHGLVFMKRYTAASWQDYAEVRLPCGCHLFGIDMREQIGRHPSLAATVVALLRALDRARERTGYATIDRCSFAVFGESHPTDDQ